MRSDYLNISQSTKVDANGNATVKLSPSVGQYWIPTFLRVSSMNQASPYPYCAVYLGAGSITDATTFIDDTYKGSQDSSSIISGTVVRYGETIVAVWSGAHAGDTVTLTIYGQTTDAPPNVQDMAPFSPGTHFAHKDNERVDILSTVSTTVAPGGFLNSPVMDVRQYQSYYLTAASSVNSGGTTYSTFEVRIIWVDENSNLVFSDYYEWWNDSVFAASASLGPVQIQDSMHGPYCVLQFSNNGVDPVSFNYEWSGTTRAIPGPYVRQANQATDGVLVNRAVTLPSQGIPCALSYGRYYVRLQNTGAAAMVVSAQCGSTVNYVINAGLAGNSFSQSELIFPKRALRLIATGTAGQTFTATVISHYDKV